VAQDALRSGRGVWFWESSEESVAGWKDELFAGVGEPYGYEDNRERDVHYEVGQHYDRCVAQNIAQVAFDAHVVIASFVPANLIAKLLNFVNKWGLSFCCIVRGRWILNDHPVVTTLQHRRTRHYVA
jgi:hypothetical protein